MKRSIAMVIVGCALGWTAQAGAGVTPEQKCQSLKDKEAGKYAYCRQKAEAEAGYVKKTV